MRRGAMEIKFSRGVRETRGRYAQPEASLCHPKCPTRGSERSSGWQKKWGSKAVHSHGRWKPLILIECGVDVRSMKAADMRRVLGEMPDFKYEKTKVEKNLCSRGHRVIFIPQFHCEIERCWGHAKHCTRQHCDYTFQGLERTIERALNNVSVTLIRKYFRKSER